MLPVHLPAGEGRAGLWDPLTGLLLPLIPAPWYLEDAFARWHRGTKPRALSSASCSQRAANTGPSPRPRQSAAERSGFGPVSEVLFARAAPTHGRRVSVVNKRFCQNKVGCCLAEPPACVEQGAGPWGAAAGCGDREGVWE